MAFGKAKVLFKFFPEALNRLRIFAVKRRLLLRARKGFIWGHRLIRKMVAAPCEYKSKVAMRS